MTLTSLCPVCQASRTPQDTTCHACGLVFASFSANTIPLPSTAISSCPPPALGATSAYYTPLVAGQTLANGRYAIQRVLSRGGMATLYLAIDHTAFDRTVVIKAMLDYFDPTNPAEVQQAQDRFLAEAQTLALLRHPAIPQIYSYFQDGVHNYIVMEYIEGADLEQGLTRTGEVIGQIILGACYPQEQVIAWGIALCRVLEYLASCQPPVIHHDIKPTNILLDQHTGEVRLVDFGTARAHLLVQANGRVGLQQSSLYGTQGYAAPEQYQARSEPRSDVYALAATLYHLATNDDPSQHPFDFPRLDALVALGEILRPALDSDVTQRPTATALRQRLEALKPAAHRHLLKAPEGTRIGDIPALVHWCEQHWYQARSWLETTLPDDLEVVWGATKLAQELRTIRQQQPNRDAGLDAVLAHLDPQGFGTALPQMTANTQTIDFGRLLARTHTQHVVLTNSGRRCIQAAIERPPEMRVDSEYVQYLRDTATPGSNTRFQSMLFLPPGERTKADVVIERALLSKGGKLTRTITFWHAASPLLDLDIKARVSPIRLFGNRHPGCVVGLIFALIVLLFCTVPPMFSSSQFKTIVASGPRGSESQRADYYQEGLDALAREDWRKARRSFRSASDESETAQFLQGSPDELIQESYYLEGQQAIEAQDLTAAKAAFAEIPDYRDVATIQDTLFERILGQDETFRLMIDTQEHLISDISFGADSQTIATANSEGTIHIWQVADGALVQEVGSRGMSMLSPDSQFMANTNAQGRISLRQIQDGALMPATTFNEGWPAVQAAFSPNSQLLIGADREEVKVWRVSDGALVQTINNGDAVDQIAVGEDIIAVMSQKEKIKLWRISDGMPLRILYENPLSLAFSPDEQTLAASTTNQIVLWRVSDGQKLWQTTAESGCRSDMCPLAFSPDNRFLASINDQESTIQLWRTSDGALIDMIVGYGKMRSIAFSPDGQILAARNTDGKVMLWDLHAE